MSVEMRSWADRMGAKLETIRPELTWLAWACMGFLAGRATLLDNLRPFGAAYLCACGVMGLPGLPALLGVCVGILCGGFNLLNAAVLVPPALCFFALFVLRRSGRVINVGWGALLLMAARLVYLPLRPFLIYYLIQFAIETGIALIGYYALVTAAKAYDEGRPVAGAEALVGAAVTAGVFLAGVPDIPGFSLKHLLAILLTLTAALAGGAAAGAAGGLAVGLVVALSGANETLFAATLGLCGLLAGVFRPLKRYGMAGGFALGAALMSAWASNLFEAAVPWLELAAGCVLFMALPEKLWSALRLRLNQGAEGDEGTKELRLLRMRETVVTKMQDFSKCLEELSGVFGETARDGAENWEEVAPLLEAVSAEACQKCSKKERCWQQEFYTTYGYFLKALASPGSRKVLLESDFPQEFRESCRQFPEVAASLRNAWGLFRVKSGYRRRIDESRALAGKQLKGVAEVMERMAAQFNLQIRANEDLVQVVREAMRAAGAHCRSISVQEGRAFGLTVSLGVKPCGGRRKCRAYEEALSTALGRPMRRTATACNPTETVCRLDFQQARAMRVTCAGVQKAREGATCGDACVWESLDDGSYFLAISDGMGTGARAAMESQATLGLLRRFYQAGFAEDVIYDTINQVMLLRSSGETFSTVDLCLLNLIDGEANFIKIGAPPTFLIRQGEVYPISSPTLPLGILDEISPGAVKRILQDGDVLVLVSDGVTNNEETEWLEEELKSLKDCEPHQLATRLLEFAGMRYGRADDMTVLAARVRLPRALTGSEIRAKKRLVRWKARVAGSSD